jgi:hypothetical protein
MLLQFSDSSSFKETFHQKDVRCVWSADIWKGDIYFFIGEERLIHYATIARGFIGFTDPKGRNDRSMARMEAEA